MEKQKAIEALCEAANIASVVEDIAFAAVLITAIYFISKMMR